MYRRLSSQDLGVRVSSSSQGSLIFHKSSLHIFYFMFMIVCVHVHTCTHMCRHVYTNTRHDMDVEVRGQFPGVDFLLQCRF